MSDPEKDKKGTTLATGLPGAQAQLCLVGSRAVCVSEERETERGQVRLRLGVMGRESEGKQEAREREPEGKEWLAFEPLAEPSSLEGDDRWALQSHCSAPLGWDVGGTAFL